MGRLEDSREVLSSWLYLNVVPAVGNQHLFKGPDDLNGNGYFLHALVLDRGGSPGKLRRGVRVVVRHVAFSRLV